MDDEAKQLLREIRDLAVRAMRRVEQTAEHSEAVCQRMEKEHTDANRRFVVHSSAVVVAAIMMLGGILTCMIIFLVKSSIGH